MMLQDNGRQSLRNGWTLEKQHGAILVSGLKDKLVSLAAIGIQIAKDHPSKFLVNYIADNELIYIGLDGPVHASLIIDKIMNL